MDCLNSLVSLKELCTIDSAQPLFWLDDAEGLDRESLSQLAKPSNGSGKAFGASIIDTAGRLLMADIESLVPKGYAIKSSLNSFCNNCTYTVMSSGTSFTGVVIKNISNSKNTYLSIDSLKVMIGSSGTYNIVLDDGVTPKIIEHNFVAGTEVVISNIPYKTSHKSVKVYFLEPGVLVTALNCPTQKSCGCSGSTVNSKEISVKGLYNNTEFTTQYGFVPCASVICSMDNILCSIVNQQPRLFALALFYRSAAKYFADFAVTQRNNRNASFDTEEKLALANQYMELYYERLRGSGNVKGIADNLSSVLNNLSDPCIECSRMVTTAWAIS